MLKKGDVLTRVRCMLGSSSLSQYKVLRMQGRFAICRAEATGLQVSVHKEPLADGTYQVKHDGFRPSVFDRIYPDSMRALACEEYQKKRTEYGSSFRHSLAEWIIKAAPTDVVEQLSQIKTNLTGVGE